MRLLLDTHAFIWWMDEDPKLPLPARTAILDEANEVFVSIASAWEIAIKRSLGKLRAPPITDLTLTSQDFRLLPITLSHIDRLQHLPRLHADPFDRMLLAQAAAENLTIVSRDPKLDGYEVPVLW